MVSHSLAAVKRLRKELQVLHKSGIDTDIILEVENDNLLKWKAYIKGPIETPYEGGVFELDIKCTNDYPLIPPNIKFITKIFHPNVHFRSGDICLDILKKEWSPAWGLQASCRAVLALLSDPDADSPLNCDAGNMVRNHDMIAYTTTARMYTIENAFYYNWPPNKKITSTPTTKPNPSTTTATTPTSTTTTTSTTRTTTTTPSSAVSAETATTTTT